MSKDFELWLDYNMATIKQNNDGTYTVDPLGDDDITATREELENIAAEAVEEYRKDSDFADFEKEFARE